MALSGRPVRAWRNRRYNVQVGSAYTLMIVVYLNALATYRSGPAYAINGVIIVLLLMLLIRVLRAATIVVYRDGVVIRKLFRTHTLPWDVIIGIEAVDTVSSHGHSGNKILIRLDRGRPIVDGEIYARKLSGKKETYVDRAVRDLNERLKDWRSANGRAPSLSDVGGGRG